MAAVGWYEVTLKVPTECGDAVANFLFESGAPGLQWEDHAEATLLTAHFPHAPPLVSLRRFCAAIGCVRSGKDELKILVRRLPADDWAENWKRHFPPQIVGQRLYICPPWDSTPPPGRLAIVIDPGMAFGTGQHATTRGCLLLLERAMSEGHTTRALDVGTGSGVLAIAMAKLGATEVWATDTDPLARGIAADNAKRNHVSKCIRISTSLNDVGDPFDLITANLFTNVLQEIASRLSQALVPGGIVICSGLLTDDEDSVRQTYESQGCAFRERRREEPWVSLALQRRH